MLITKPTSKRYVFHYLNNTQYTNYAQGYALSKRNGSRGIYLWASGKQLEGYFNTGVIGRIEKWGIAPGTTPPK